MNRPTTTTSNISHNNNNNQQHHLRQCADHDWSCKRCCNYCDGGGKDSACAVDNCLPSRGGGEERHCCRSSVSPVVCVRYVCRVSHIGVRETKLSYIPLDQFFCFCLFFFFFFLFLCTTKRAYITLYILVAFLFHPHDFCRFAPFSSCLRKKTFKVQKKRGSLSYRMMHWLHFFSLEITNNEISTPLVPGTKILAKRDLVQSALQKNANNMLKPKHKRRAILIPGSTHSVQKR